MKVDVRFKDFAHGAYVTRSADAIFWGEDGEIWIWASAEERKVLLNEWLEAEEDREAGRRLEILRFLAGDSYEVSERDCGPSQQWSEAH